MPNDRDPYEVPNLVEIYGYRLDSRETFFNNAPAELKTRVLQVGAADIHAADWILWDPNADEAGFLIFGSNPDALRDEFARHARGMCFTLPGQEETVEPSC